METLQCPRGGLAWWAIPTEGRGGHDEGATAEMDCDHELLFEQIVRPKRIMEFGPIAESLATKDAEQECAAFHKRTGRIIKLLTVQEILDEEHVQKM